MRTLTLLLSLSLAFALAGCACGNCTPGSKDCACKASNVCDEGLTCTANKCVGGATAGFVVSDPKARGCELVLTEAAGTSVSKVSFKNGVKGSFVKEAPRTAVAFVTETDTTIPTGGVEVALSGDAQGVTVSAVSCVDSAGVKLADTKITIR